MSQAKTKIGEEKVMSHKGSYYIETYGCQMNEYDSLIARRILDQAGSARVESPDDADLILLNTCAIRENAHTKIFNRLRALEHLHKKGAEVAVLGCMVQNLREDILYENLPIDYILGPDELRKLNQISSKPGLHGEQQEKIRSHLKLSRTELYDDLVPSVEHHLNAGSTTAFVTIQRGCDNFCTFCVVPYTRGRERSRPVDSIVNEVKKLEGAGFKSVVLLGQNVNSYQYEKQTFTNLVESLLKETNIPRIYFTSPHPKDFPTELIDLMAGNERFCNQVHMPLQAGNNEVLKRMKRHYTREQFLDIVHEFRQKVDDIAISTDVIVGFPGETAEQFEETLEVMNLADFDSAFMFAYSERKGTIASKRFADDVPEEEKKRRLNLVIDRQMSRMLRKNEKYAGQVVNILVENYSRRNKFDLVGRMSNGRKVVFAPHTSQQAVIDSQGIDSIIGTCVDIRIDRVTSNTLIGHAV